MALRMSDSREFSRRLAYAMKAAEMNAKTLSRKMDKQDGYVSWLTTEAKKVDPVIAGKVADSLAGQGDLTDDATTIVSYLLGIEHDTDKLLRLRVVNPSTRGFSSKASRDSTIADSVQST